MQEINQIREKIKQFIIETSYFSDDQINDDTLIFAQGIMDSMGFISIIGFLKIPFSFSPPIMEQWYNRMDLRISNVHTTSRLRFLCSFIILKFLETKVGKAIY